MTAINKEINHQYMDFFQEFLHDKVLDVHGQVSVMGMVTYRITNPVFLDELTKRHGNEVEGQFTFYHKPTYKGEHLLTNGAVGIATMTLRIGGVVRNIHIWLDESVFWNTETESSTVRYCIHEGLKHHDFMTLWFTTTNGQFGDDAMGHLIDFIVDSGL